MNLLMKKFKKNQNIPSFFNKFISKIIEKFIGHPRGGVGGRERDSQNSSINPTFDRCQQWESTTMLKNGRL